MGSEIGYWVYWEADCSEAERETELYHLDREAGLESEGISKNRISKMKTVCSESVLMVMENHGVIGGKRIAHVFPKAGYGVGLCRLSFFDQMSIFYVTFGHQTTLLAISFALFRPQPDGCQARCGTEVAPLTLGQFNNYGWRLRWR